MVLARCAIRSTRHLSLKSTAAKNDGCTHEVVARLRDARGTQTGREQYGRK